MTDESQPPFDLAAHLRDSLGVDPELVAAAEADGPEEVRRLAQTVVLLGEPPSLRPPDAWERTGASEELGRRLWRAMGFAELPDDAVALTSADVDALAAIHDFLETSGISPETVIRFARLLGQSMSRVADALHSIVDQAVAEMEDLPPGEIDDIMVLAAENVNPVIERELSYLLRRHLYAGAIRRIAGVDLEQPELTVGFADVVSYTRLSGRLPESDLAELLETFEATTADMITDSGGRVIKLIGDAVLFVFDHDPATAADLALRLVESFGEGQPELRVGLAHGTALSRLGDLFGPTVNLASRLVSFARPGTVVVDQAFVDVLGAAGVEEVTARSLRPRELKGFGTTALYVLRRRP